MLRWSTALLLLLLTAVTASMLYLDTLPSARTLVDVAFILSLGGFLICAVLTMRGALLRWWDKHVYHDIDERR